MERKKGMDVNLCKLRMKMIEGRSDRMGKSGRKGSLKGGLK